MNDKLSQFWVCRVSTPLVLSIAAMSLSGAALALTSNPVGADLIAPTASAPSVDALTRSLTCGPDGTRICTPRGCYCT